MICLLLPLLLGAQTAAKAATLRVPSVYPTIQEGIDAATAGDTVLVEPGTYTEPFQATAHGPSMLVMKSGIVLLGEGGAEKTVLDALEGGRVIYCGDLDDTPLIEGFTLRNGRAVGDGLYEDHGGAILCFHSSPTLLRCDFLDNAATVGGGVAADHPSVLTVVECGFRGNTASEGGGLVLLGSSAGEVTRCDFSDNHAVRGGGMQCRVSTPSLTECLFVGNSATETGGGLDCFLAFPTLTRCTFSGNTAAAGGGLHTGNGGLVSILGSTFCGNAGSPGTGGGISSLGSFVELENTIIAFSDPGLALHCQDEEAGAALVCSDLFGNVGGDWVGPIAGQLGQDGNISLDPLFCASGEDDLTLHADSPCAEKNNPVCGLIGALPAACGPVVGLDPSIGTPAPLLLPPAPNPASARLTLRLDLPRPARLEIRILAPSGRRIATLLQGRVDAGRQRLDWGLLDESGRPLPSGVFFVELRTDRHRERRSFVVLR